MTATETAREGSPGAWLDEGEVSPEWTPPTVEPARQSHVPGSLIYGGVVLALVLTLALVWGLGGFGKRTDLLRHVEPGALISTGPFEFRFIEATAQQRRDSNGAVTKWELVVIGQARTTGNETIRPKEDGDYSMFVIRDPGSKTTATAESARIGDQQGNGDIGRPGLVPGLPLTPYQLTFPLPTSYQPGPTVVFAVFDLVYKASHLLDDDKEWRNGAYASRLDLPVRVLPPKD